MHRRIMMGAAALVLGTACATAPALAKKKVKPIVVHPAAYSYSNTAPTGNAPLSPGGISAAASAFGGPGYNGPYGTTSAHVAPVTYSTSGPGNAPLSPNGISAAASAFGGPGYNGPYNETTPTHGSGLNAYASTNGPSARASTATYSTLGPKGAPLSPGGISAAADAFGGPGYGGQ
jgi:hypothetical protein